MRPSHQTGCYFYVASRAWWGQLPMVECSAHTRIRSTATRTRLKQKFINTHSEDIKECTYVFPLYDGVSVARLKCQIGDRVLEGVVKGREQARTDFDQAVAKGESAALVEQSLYASDVFRTSLGNLPKGSTAFVTIEYVTELQHDAETDSIKFEMPTGIAPRYGDPKGDRDGLYARGVERMPSPQGFTWVCDVEMPHPITQVESPTHPVSIKLGQLSNSEGEPDFKLCSGSMTLQNVSGLSNDLILTVKSKGIKEPVALLETHQKLKGQRALMTTLVPNFNLPQIRPEIVFVCDRSGSMAGASIKTLVEAMRVMLHSLPATGVKFNICSFGSHCDFLFNKSQTYSKESLNRANKYLDSVSANYGGTETEIAVRETVKRRFGDIPLEIILLTDGDIWNQQSLFQYLNEQNAASKGQIRVFPLGIGSGVSTALIEGVARAGNGFAQTVKSGERMDQRCVRMLKGALSPHITDYQLQVEYEKEAEDEDDDFEIIERVEKMNELTIRDKPEQAQPTGNEKKTISLFDSSVDADVAMTDEKSFLPEVDPPKILQGPFKIPSLYPFSRSTVYLLLSPETSQRRPKKVTLCATYEGSDLKLEIPVHDTGSALTIHQLAARKVCQDFEEGRGWICEAKNADGKLLRELHPSCFDDLLQREAVRVGTRHQVMNRWCSYVALERPTGEKDAPGKVNPTAGHSSLNEPQNLVPGEDSDEDMGFALFDDGSPITLASSLPTTQSVGQVPSSLPFHRPAMHILAGSQEPSPTFSQRQASTTGFGSTGAQLFGAAPSQQQATARGSAPYASGLFGHAMSGFQSGNRLDHNYNSARTGSLFSAPTGAFGSAAPGQASLFGSPRASSAQSTSGQTLFGQMPGYNSFGQNPFGQSSFGQSSPFVANSGDFMARESSYSVPFRQGNAGFAAVATSLSSPLSRSGASPPAAFGYPPPPGSHGPSLFGQQQQPQEIKQKAHMYGQPSDADSGTQAQASAGVAVRLSSSRLMADDDDDCSDEDPGDGAVRFLRAASSEEEEDDDDDDYESEDEEEADQDSRAQVTYSLSSGRASRKSKKGKMGATRSRTAATVDDEDEERIASTSFAATRAGGRGGSIRGGRGGSFRGAEAPSGVQQQFNQMQQAAAYSPSSFGGTKLASASAKRSARRTTAQAVPIKVPQTPAETVRAVVGLQEFDGSWEPAAAGATLAAILRVAEAQLTAGGGPAGPAANAWLTAVVIAFLERRMVAEREIWEMPVDKARDWLRAAIAADADLESLVAQAAAILP